MKIIKSCGITVDICLVTVDKKERIRKAIDFAVPRDSRLEEKDKDQIEILELLFDEHMQKHIIPEIVKYAQIFQNKYTFDATEFDLRCYVGTLFLSGYYSLPQQSSLLGEES